MQALVMRDVSQIDFTLDPNHVCEQVIAKSGGQHSILDLLTITRANRLAILELKAIENPELPPQAADYWERIRRHQAQGDLARYGYFPGLYLQSAPPIVIWLYPLFVFIQPPRRSSNICLQKFKLSAWDWPKAGVEVCASSCASEIRRCIFSSSYESACLPLVSR